MNQKIDIQLKINADTGDITLVQDGLEKTTRVAKQADQSISGMGGSIKRLATYVAGIYSISQAFDAVVGSGVRFNAQIETMQTGIASLIAVNSSNITTMGESITASEKFAMAQASAANTIGLLREANLETAATLTQLTEGFQATLGPAQKAGFSIKQTVEYTKLMTQAAGAMGVPMNQLAQEMRSVVSGTIDANSVIAKNIGITNEQITAARESGQLYGFLQDKLKDFATAGEAVSNSWDGAVSNFSDAWSGLAGELTKPIFDPAKDAIKTIAGEITALTNKITQARSEAKAITAIAGKYEGGIGSENHTTRPAQYSIEALKTQLEQLTGVQGELKTATESANQPTEEQIKHFSSMAATLDPVIKAQREYESDMKLAGDNAEFQALAHEKLEKALKRIPDPLEDTRKATEKYNREIQKTITEVERWADAEQEKANTIYEKILLSGMDDYERKLYALNKEITAMVEESARNPYLNLSDDQVVSYFERRHTAIRESVAKTKEETSTIWSDIEKGLDSQFFDAMTGKFEDFGSWLSDFWKSTWNGILRGFSRTIAGGLTDTLKGIVSSIFSGSSSSSGDSIAATLQSYVDQGYGYVLKDGQYTVMDDAGNTIDTLSGSSDSVSTIVSAIKTGYQVVSDGVSSTLMSIPNALVSAGQATGISSLGYLGAGSKLWLSGAAYQPLSTAGTIGYYGTGAAVGGLEGYALGSLGDSLFGADTYASTTGAIGGSIGGILGAMGSLGGPLGALAGAAAGSVIGGMFGKWKHKESGISLASDLEGFDLELLTKGTGQYNLYDQSAGVVTDPKSVLNTYSTKEKKGWFSSSSKTQYEPLDPAGQATIIGAMSSYEGFLKDLGAASTTMTITATEAGRKWKDGKLIEEVMPEEFFKNLMGIQDTVITAMKKQFSFNFDAVGDDEGSAWQIGEVAVTTTGPSEEDAAKLKAVQEEWEAFAKDGGVTIPEALSQGLQSAKSIMQSIEAQNLSRQGLNGAGIIETENALDTLTAARNQVGVLTGDMGKITAQNFQEMYSAALRNNPTPTTIEAFNALGAAIEAVAAKAAQTETTLTQYALGHNMLSQEVYHNDIWGAATDQFLESADWAQEAGIKFDTATSFMQTAYQNLDNLTDEQKAQLSSITGTASQITSEQDSSKLSSSGGSASVPDQEYVYDFFGMTLEAAVGKMTPAPYEMPVTTLSAFETELKKLEGTVTTNREEFEAVNEAVGVLRSHLEAMSSNLLDFTRKLGDESTFYWVDEQSQIQSVALDAQRFDNESQLMDWLENNLWNITATDYGKEYADAVIDYWKGQWSEEKGILQEISRWGQEYIYTMGEAARGLYSDRTWIGSYGTATQTVQYMGADLGLQGVEDWMLGEARGIYTMTEADIRATYSQWGMDIERFVTDGVLDLESAKDFLVSGVYDYAGVMAQGVYDLQAATESLAGWRKDLGLQISDTKFDLNQKYDAGYDGVLTTQSDIASALTAVGSARVEERQDAADEALSIISRWQDQQLTLAQKQLSVLDEEIAARERFNSIAAKLNDQIAELAKYSQELAYSEHSSLSLPEQTAAALSGYTETMTALRGAISDGDTDTAASMLSQVRDSVPAYLNALKNTSQFAFYDQEFGRVQEELMGLSGLQIAQKSTEELLEEQRGILMDINGNYVSYMEELNQVTATNSETTRSIKKSAEKNETTLLGIYQKISANSELFDTANNHLAAIVANTSRRDPYQINEINIRDYVHSSSYSSEYGTGYGSSNSSNYTREYTNYQTVKFFAQGGIVTEPTLGMVGEAGYPEAVLPLKDRFALRTDAMEMTLEAILEMMTKLWSLQKKQEFNIDSLKRAFDVGDAKVKTITDTDTEEPAA